MSKARRIIDVALDEESVARRTPEVEHERAVALFDLLEENDFALAKGEPGPYRLRIAISEQRLVFDVRDEQDSRVLRSHVYHDWHRVERATLSFSLEIQALLDRGWVEMDSERPTFRSA